MVDSRHINARLFLPLAVLLGDLIIVMNQTVGRHPAQAHDDFGPQQGYLSPEKVDAGILLGVQRVPVLGRAALDDVADVYVFLPAQAHEGEHLIQQLTRFAHKGDSLLVLVLPWAFSHHHDLCVVGTYPKHHVGPGVSQSAPLAVPARLFQLFPASHKPLPLPNRIFSIISQNPGQRYENFAFPLCDFTYFKKIIDNLKKTA